MKLVNKLTATLLTGLFMTAPLHAGASTSTWTRAEAGSIAIVAAIDKNEILAGVVASHKKLNADIKNFAQMMVAQHGENLTQILSMADDRYPLLNSQAEAFATEGKKALARLGAMNGSAFAAAYVDAMVKGHIAALNLIDNQLMKTATSPDVKKFMMETRTTVAIHLAHAKRLQEKMRS